MTENYLAQDALRMAVDYHAQTHKGGGMQEQRDLVLRTAEQFYQWLDEKHREGKR